jgi:WD40 repeat protein
MEPPVSNTLETACTSCTSCTSCTFCAMDGFRDTVAIAMLSPERDSTLRHTHPELHARLSVSDEPCVVTTDDDVGCTHTTVGTLFCAGVADGVDAHAYRRHRQFSEGATYFVLPSRRLSSVVVGDTKNTLCFCNVSTDGKTLVVGKNGSDFPDATVTVRDVETGLKRQEFNCSRFVASTCLTGDGKTLGYVESVMHWHGTPTCSTVVVRDGGGGGGGGGGKETHHHTFAYDTPVTSSCSCLSDDGTTLAVSGQQNTLVRTLSTAATTLLPHEGEHMNRVTAIHLSGDGQTLVTVEHDQFSGYFLPVQNATITVRDVDTGAQLQQFHTPHPVTTSSLSIDGKTLLLVAHGKLSFLGTPDGDATVTLRKWDETDAFLQVFETAHAVTSACLSGDGRTVVTIENVAGKGGVGGLVRVRTVGGTGEEIQTFEHEQEITSASLSGDGTILAFIDQKHNFVDKKTTSTLHIHRI